MKRARLNLEQDSFLTQYWQREPLLIRNAIDNFHTPLSADEVAGLALEEEVESRIIEHRDGHWQLHHGPFKPRDFQRDCPWTLLVQAVDHYIPAVAELRQLLNFLPSWRMDDVMVSYAADGGSVGPHYDNYDVFLLQGEGERLWRVGQACDENTALLPHPDLRILHHFHCQQEYLLGPGDILYLPPGVAHWGEAQGECTTFSLGFRAPRMADLVSRWADNLLEQLSPGLFYSDGAMAATSCAGEIRPRDQARATALLEDALASARDNQWFGTLVTEPRYDCTLDDAQLAEARQCLAQGPDFVTLSPAARVAWQREVAGITVFANGESALFDGNILETITTLCSQGCLAGEQLMHCIARPETASLLYYLAECGGIHVE